MKNVNSSKNSKQTSNSNCNQPGHLGAPISTNSTESVHGNHLQQARYWIGTIPESNWTPILPAGVQYVRGQLECGASGFRHYQLVVSFSQKKTLRQLHQIFGRNCGHWEPTRSSAANAYVWKSDTRIGEYI